MGVETGQLWGLQSFQGVKGYKCLAVLEPKRQRDVGTVPRKPWVGTYGVEMGYTLG